MFSINRHYVPGLARRHEGRLLAICVDNSRSGLPLLLSSEPPLARTRRRITKCPNATFTRGKALGQFLQQRLRALQIFGAETFGEPSVDRRQLFTAIKTGPSAASSASS